MTVTDDTPVIELTEAKCRELMAERARMPLTWETQGRRAELDVEIQALLDLWLRLGAA